jgi:hypothetical protein
MKYTETNERCERGKERFLFQGSDDYKCLNYSLFFLSVVDKNKYFYIQTQELPVYIHRDVSDRETQVCKPKRTSTININTNMLIKRVKRESLTILQ